MMQLQLKTCFHTYIKYVFSLSVGKELVLRVHNNGQWSILGDASSAEREAMLAYVSMLE